MKAFIFEPSNKFIGKLDVGSLDEIPDKVREFHVSNKSVPIYSYVEASGKTWTIVSLDPFQLDDGRVSPTPRQQSSSSSATSHDPAGTSAKLSKRYRDAYLVARTIVTVGSVVKGIGIFLAIVITLAAFVVASQGQDNFKMGLAGILIGVVVGVPLYVLGILVSAQGQILKATLDVAVNGSPFLSNDQKAEMMLLV